MYLPLVVVAAAVAVVAVAVVAAVVVVVVVAAVVITRGAIEGSLKRVLETCKLASSCSEGDVRSGEATATGDTAAACLLKNVRDSFRMTWQPASSS